MAGLLNLMMREEYRLHISYSSRRMFFAMPLYVVIFTAFFAATLGSIPGDISIEQVIVMLNAGVFIYGVSVGAFGFLGRTYIERRYGKVNFLVAMPFLIPVTFRRVYLNMFLRDLVFYSVLILVPAFLGLGLASIVTNYRLVSITLLFIALFLSFLMGISFSFFISVLYTRSVMLFIGAVSVFIALILAYGYWNAFPLQYIVPSIGMQLAVQPFGSDGTMAIVYALLSLFLSLGFTLTAVTLVKVDYESKRSRYDERFYAYKKRFQAFRSYDSILAKEFVDIVRSGLASKMIFAYVAPLLFLSVSTWYINTGLNIPVGFNVVFYAGMVGFFGVMVYNWLTNVDLLDYYETMPLSVPTIIRAKIVAHLVLTSIVSIVFVVLVGFANQETTLLWLALPVLVITSTYMVMATAYLTGLRTNAFLFDPGVMAKFALVAMVPDIAITILSFSVNSAPTIAVTGIGIALAILLVATRYFYKGIGRKWGETSFT